VLLLITKELTAKLFTETADTVDRFVPVITICPVEQPLAGEIPVIVGGAQAMTVEADEAALTHFPTSVCVAVSASPGESVNPETVHVPPLTVVVPIETPLLIRLIVAPFTPVPETVVPLEQIVPTIAGAAEIEFTVIVALPSV
jgi:hypothetical protein